ncbi:hypothetical protein DUNSADRAFT_5576 [Dunaliella salina]|uniref:Uncharacterized protein n=1 Tax=Dunaliella salina TaxID=3046 RepID=A0ABQ7GQ39_DUNSA|nr:hypothetical protein DUNSADRAFT_5576 [Dunaliella salina]|eukprot:KAF5836701.1 hypothetical protein DUNSADRAFT_5576 [Dunaliella salina]
MDQPLNALAMITSWTRNQTLARAHHITPLEARAHNGPLSGVDDPAAAKAAAAAVKAESNEAAARKAWQAQAKGQQHSMKTEDSREAAMVAADGNPSEVKQAKAGATEHSSSSSSSSSAKPSAHSATMFVRSIAKATAAQGQKLAASMARRLRVVA